MRRLALLGLVLALTACGKEAVAPAPTPPPPSAAAIKLPAGGLPAAFDCVRANGVVIEAHRGGLTPGYAENTLEVFENTLSRGIFLLEVDVRETSDAKLVLFHDAKIGNRPIGKVPFADLKEVGLADPQGKPVTARIPTLEAALDWAKGKAILLLDIKQETDPARVLKEISRTSAGGWVIVIAYTIDDAITLQRINPNLMLSVNINSADDINRLRDAGADLPHILGFTGTKAPDTALYKSLAAAGIETVFGTLGTKGYDVEIAAQDNDHLYQVFVDQGVQVIATDRPFAVAAGIEADDKATAACFSGKNP